MLSSGALNVSRSYQEGVVIVIQRLLVFRSLRYAKTHQPKSLTSSFRSILANPRKSEVNTLNAGTPVSLALGLEMVMFFN